MQPLNWYADIVDVFLFYIVKAQMKAAETAFPSVWTVL